MTDRPFTSKPQFFKGSTGRSREEALKVTPASKILIPIIAEDYHIISKDKTRKISQQTLKYLKDRGIIKSEYYFLYSQVSERPEERTLIPERSVIEIVNEKLVWLYESI